MPDILIRGYKAKEQIEEIIQEARYAMNNSMVGSGLEIIELPAHGDLKDANKLLAEFERDERAADEHGREFSFSFDSGGARCTEWWIVQQKLMDAPVIVPASEEVADG